MSVQFGGFKGRACIRIKVSQVDDAGQLVGDPLAGVNIHYQFGSEAPGQEWSQKGETFILVKEGERGKVWIEDDKYEMVHAAPLIMTGSCSGTIEVREKGANYSNISRIRVRATLRDKDGTNKYLAGVPLKLFPGASAIKSGPIWRQETKGEVANEICGVEKGQSYQLTAPCLWQSDNGETYRLAKPSNGVLLVQICQSLIDWTDGTICYEHNETDLVLIAQHCGQPVAGADFTVVANGQMKSYTALEDGTCSVSVPSQSQVTISGDVDPPQTIALSESLRKCELRFEVCAKPIDCQPIQLDRTHAIVIDGVTDKNVVFDVLDLDGVMIRENIRPVDGIVVIFLPNGMYRVAARSGGITKQVILETKKVEDTAK